MSSILAKFFNDVRVGRGRRSKHALEKIEACSFVQK